jgi:hypothetical protein
LKSLIFCSFSIPFFSFVGCSLSSRILIFYKSSPLKLLAKVQR